MTDVPPGWKALDEALTPLYGTQRPRHFGTLIPYRAGGPDPLAGISAYRAAPPPHFHLVSYGLTELFTKESPNAAVSGFGFELTFRVRGDPEAAEPEPWALGLLQSLARYVYSTRRHFEPGHFLELPEPVTPGFRTVAFASDPALPVSRGPFGSFEFLQVVPLLDDELWALKAWNTLGLLGVGKDAWIFSPSRRSVLDDPEIKAAFEAGRAKEGSATPRLRVAQLSWGRATWGGGLELAVGGDAAQALRWVLPGRIPFGRPLELWREDVPVLRLVPGRELDARAEGPTLEIALTAEAAQAWAEGRPPGFPGLSVQQPKEVSA